MGFGLALAALGWVAACSLMDDLSDISGGVRPGDSGAEGAADAPAPLTDGPRGGGDDARAEAAVDAAIVDGGGCSGSCTPTVIATAQPGETVNVRAQDGFVYWVNFATPGQVRRCARASCGTTTVDLASNEPQPAGLLLDNGSVYWGRIGVPRGVLACPLEGGTPARFVATISGDFGANDIAIGDKTLLFTNIHGGSVLSARAAAVDASANVLYTDLGANTLRVVAASSDVFWSQSDGKVQRCPLTGCVGGRPTLIYASPAGDASPSAALGLTLLGSYLYVTIPADHKIVRCRVDTVAPCGSGETVATGTNPNEITNDGTSIFWTDDGDEVVKMISVSPTLGAPEIIAKGQVSAGAIATDDMFVYWANRYRGQVMMLKKP